MNDQQLIFDIARNTFPAHFAKLIVCQAIHETGNFTSLNLQRNNNYFGYSFVHGDRHQLPKQNGEHDHGTFYAGYANRENSVHEIVDYYQRRMKENYFPDPGQIRIWDFASELKECGYYTDKILNYYNGILDAWKHLLLPEIQSFNQ